VDGVSEHFEIYQEGNAGAGGTDGEGIGTGWRWRLRGPNGETITSAESYADHAECLLAVYIVRRTNSHTPIRDA
jgi:uncharacterized protein YegP (UPF0339 family)